MNNKRVLEKLGYVDGVDFEILSETTFAMLEKISIVEITPAVYDENGIEITPAVTEQQSYTPSAPSMEVMEETWAGIQIDDSDIIMLINEYLSDKNHLRDFENDSLNIFENRIFGWNYVNIPQPTILELASLIPSYEAKKEKKSRVESLKASGKKDREISENVLNLIAGFNRDRILTSEQISTMVSTFGPINNLLKDARPTSAKALIQAIVPDGDLVTEEMKEMILDELVGV